MNKFIGQEIFEYSYKFSYLSCTGSLKNHTNPNSNLKGQIGETFYGYFESDNKLTIVIQLTLLLCNVLQ